MTRFVRAYWQAADGRTVLAVHKSDDGEHVFVIPQPDDGKMHRVAASDLLNPKLWRHVRDQEPLAPPKAERGAH